MKQVQRKTTRNRNRNGGKRRFTKPRAGKGEAWNYQQLRAMLPSIRDLEQPRPDENLSVTCADKQSNQPAMPSVPPAGVADAKAGTESAETETRQSGDTGLQREGESQ